MVRAVAVIRALEVAVAVDREVAVAPLIFYRSSSGQFFFHGYLKVRRPGNQTFLLSD